MVILSTVQLVPLVERAIERAFETTPQNLTVEPTFLSESQHQWEVSAEYDAGGEHHRVDLTLEPRTGRLLGAREARDPRPPSRTMSTHGTPSRRTGP